MMYDILTKAERGKRKWEDRRRRRWRRPSGL